MRDEEAAGAADAVLLDVCVVGLAAEVELVGTDAVEEELEVGAGALLVDGDELGVLEASGSTYC